jgi:hypothetical protein
MMSARGEPFAVIGCCCEGGERYEIAKIHDVNLDRYEELLVMLKSFNITNNFSYLEKSSAQFVDEVICVSIRIEVSPLLGK